MPPHRGPQRGSVALAVLLAMVVLVSAWSLERLQRGMRQRRDDGIAAVEHGLLTARNGLLDALALKDAAAVPGGLPFPDLNFEGSANASCFLGSANAPTAFQPGHGDWHWHCVGQLPWRDLGGDTRERNTAGETGETLWYAVSANLLDLSRIDASHRLQSGCVDRLNSRSLSQAAGTGRCNTTGLPFTWLTVRNADGQIVTDEAVAVLLWPGPPLEAPRPPNSQSKGTNRQLVGGYLDAVDITTAGGGAVTGHFDNAALDDTFIAAPDGSIGRVNVRYGQPYRFNDRLQWIGRRDYLEQLLRQVTTQIAAALPVSPTAFPASRPEFADDNYRYHWGGPDSVVRYRRVDDATARIGFDGCTGEQFEIRQDVAMHRNTIQRVAPCA